MYRRYKKREEKKYVENKVYFIKSERKIKRRGWNWGSRGNFDFGGIDRSGDYIQITAY